MLGLVDQRLVNPGRKGHVYPEAIAAHILYVKQLYPPIHDREIVRIVQRKFGYTTNHHTVKHFLERFAIPVQLELNLLAFAEFDDAYQARWTVIPYSQNIRIRFPTGVYASTITHTSACLLRHSYPYSASI